MATLQLTHAPILNSSAQVLILPVNSAGILLDSVLVRTKTLYPDNYQRYHRACRDGHLKAGSCLLHKRTREQAGLGASSNANQPSYIANLIVSNHPYNPIRFQWLDAALLDLGQQLIPLIRYQGMRKMALLARPLVSKSMTHNLATAQQETPSLPKTSPLDWQTDVLPLLTQHLQKLPKLHIDLHLPKSIHI